MTITVKQKERFFSIFSLEVQSIATQSVAFNPKTTELEYGKPLVTGETVLVVLRYPQNLGYLEIEGLDEHAMISKWIKMFEDCKENIEEFIEMAENDGEGDFVF